ncbi:OmpA family protein [Methyloprofundus sp.]|uniref:OmpA family protein n=1 Tax=Methyloprofundus sp. TaxID=2020875 RepID=UPI003D0C682D
MKKPITKLATIICLGFFIVPTLLAKEVKIYTEGNVPSAEEMANILLGSTSEAYNKNKNKTRSITFGSTEKYKPVSIGLPILFDYNSSVLKTTSLTYLKQLGTMLNLEKMTNENIMIVGHSDSTGHENYNLELSKRRSQAVKEFLVSNYQIDPARIETTGKGESDTLQGKPGDSPVNRRVEFYRIQ